MKLTEVFSSELSDKEKVEAISIVVVKAREAYGNVDVDIEVPKVQTSEGYVSLTYLSDKDKVSLAELVVNEIKREVSSFTENTEGTVFDKEVERLLATNSVLTNLSVQTDSNYL